MKVSQFLAQHGIAENPFGQEDAQTDHIFQRHLLDGTHHPAWDKIFGNPDNPSTSVVFGQKGSGKTALRLQIASQLQQHNRQHPQSRVFVIEYDDFNPFLDAFRERLHGRKRKAERALSQWRLWDHMDAILSLGVTRLIGAILSAPRVAGVEPREPPAGQTAAGSGSAFQPTPAGGGPVSPRPEQWERLTRLQKRDLLLLAAFYDHTFDQPPKQRWSALRRKLKYARWWSDWDFALGIAVAAGTVAAVIHWSEQGVRALWSWWVLAIVLCGWLPWLWRQARLFWTAWRVSKQIRVLEHAPNTLRQILARFPRQELAGQPIPSKDRSDDRYELLLKLQTVLKVLGYPSIVVLVDRVDEPHLINGSAERMRDLLWPMFDNKFLKHPGIGFKLLLPAEVTYYLNREEKEFYERSRLDKQNLIPSLEWTGESLYDVANDRIRACTRPGENPVGARSLFDEAISEQELIGVFARLRVPRHLFKFLYRVLVEHCHRYTDEHPSWKISRETLQSTLALYLRDLEAFDRGLGTG